MPSEFATTIVKAKGFAAFPPLQQQAPLLRAVIFAEVRVHLNAELVKILRGSTTTEVRFGEIAYICLCLASAGHMELLRGAINRIKPVSTNFSVILSRRYRGTEQTLPYLYTQGRPRTRPGPAPSQTTYWFGEFEDSVLVHLVVSLDDPLALHTAVAHVRKKALEEKPNKTSLGLLMSSEHIVLLQIYADGNKVDRTEPMTLFTTKPRHLRRDQDQWHRKRTLEQLPPAQATERDAGLDTFFCLMRFLEVAARRQLPVRATAGILPLELDIEILRYIEDVKAYRACLNASRTFRDILLERSLVAEGNYPVSLMTDLKMQTKQGNLKGMEKGYVATKDAVYFDTSAMMFVRGAYHPRLENTPSFSIKPKYTQPIEGTSNPVELRFEGIPKFLGVFWPYRWQVLLGGGKRYPPTLLPYTWLSWESPTEVWE